MKKLILVIVCFLTLKAYCQIKESVESRFENEIVAENKELLASMRVVKNYNYELKITNWSNGWMNIYSLKEIGSNKRFDNFMIMEPHADCYLLLRPVGDSDYIDNPGYRLMEVYHVIWFTSNTKRVLPYKKLLMGYFTGTLRVIGRKGEYDSINETNESLKQKTNRFLYISKYQFEYNPNVSSREIEMFTNRFYHNKINDPDFQLQVEKAKIAQKEELKKFQQRMAETTETGEPTEWQMRYAIDYQVQIKNKEIDKMANVEATDGPSALIKLFGALGSGTTSQISHFEKYGCVKANSKPGFTCDYVIEIKISGGITGSMYGDLVNQMGSAEVKTARFLKVKGIWKVVEYLSDN